MKRKRKESCPSPILDDSPKRMKVQAQRKFAQNSSVHSPAITPIRDLETADLLPHANVLPEPVELLPMKRPNTEDFLTFLCFRGTPILPTNLQFFNTASIVADGQVHEIKGDSVKNGPIDIAKCAGGSSEKPFIAFGVRKRADPIVISKQMEKKRRHALALQALRRKYQEQKMAKIRALTISKLSEKTTNKTLVKTNTIQKTETVTKKTNTMQKTKVIATKHVKVTTQTLKTSLKPKVKPKMCLRSFRGKFVQKELPFRAKKPLLVKEKGKKPAPAIKKVVETPKIVREKKVARPVLKNAPKPVQTPLKRLDNTRVTRSGLQRVKRRIIISNTPATVVKPKLRSTTTKKTIISRKKAQQRHRTNTARAKPDKNTKNPAEPVNTSSDDKKPDTKKPEATKKDQMKKEVSTKRLTRKDTESVTKQSEKQLELKLTKNVEVKIAETTGKKETKRNVSLKKEINLKTNGKEVKKNVDLKKTSDTVTEKKEDGLKIRRDVKTLEVTVKKVVKLAKTKHENTVVDASNNDACKKPRNFVKNKGEEAKKVSIKKSEPIKRKVSLRRHDPEQKLCSRPTRKTKEAAAIYMEILSKKLVSENRNEDEDNVSIDSFPELPNVKKTEQRENELKAQAKTTKEPEPGKKLAKIKKEEDVKEEKPILEVKNEIKSPVVTSPKRVVLPESDIAPPAKIEKLDGVVKEQKIEEVTSGKRQTRSSTQINPSDSDSSDESFHADIKVPRKKKVTRNRVKPVSVLEKNVDIILEAARVLEAEIPPENQSQVVSEPKPNPHEPKPKLIEPKPKLIEPKPKLIEPKPKLIESKPKLIEPKPKLIEPKPKVIELKPKLIEPKPKLIEPQPKLIEPKLIEPKPKLIELKPKLIEPKPKLIEPKPKQSESDESTTSDINLKSLQTKQRIKKLSKTKSTKSSSKSAQSFSDSDEEPLSKLTSKKTKTKQTRKTADKTLVEVSVDEPKPKRECTKRPSNYLPMLSSSEEDEEPYFLGFDTSKEELKKPKSFVQSLAPSLDLLSKDIGRKGKVNMSNEQIEQWLKDSAMAGSVVAKENDAMPKFGQPPDTKPNELEDAAKPPTSAGQPKSEVKSPLGDRKWIFKKDKKDSAPNKNAFSPDNERSVYAFGEENEEVICTPFRRPSRRPSSTATSKSEDELSKNDDTPKQSPFRKPDSEDSRCFNIPQNPTKSGKISKGEPMVPPSTIFHGKRPTKPLFEKIPEPFDEHKYKIPSSPSASSGSSAKLYKKPNQKQKGRGFESATPIYVSDFPKPNDPAKFVEAPVFHPTEQDFHDPLEYIERIRHKAEQFGICRIVPPSSFKPECKVTDDMRFTAYNQYVHKMLHRWGPNFKEFMAIKKYLATQNITLKTPPWIGGMEIDLPRLYQTVQSLGGLKEVIEKKRWPKVSDNMKIPKSAQDRVTKLDDIYCKYLLPYDTLSPAEREKLFNEVDTYWAKKESRNSGIKNDQKADDGSDGDDDYSDDNETDECTVKGKNMALNAFYRIARNTMSMYFKVAEPSALEVEQEFWRYVTQKQNHICVHSASIDCGNWGYGFPVAKNSPFAKHPWNLKVLTNNNGSVLRSLGPAMGVTVPTLHVGMVFSTCCWYRDPHGLPWVEYLHTGGSKIWYGIPSSACDVFHAAMQKLVPNYCREKELWLPSDTAMVPPSLLMENQVSLCRTIQEPGQFLVVFPKVFTSSISTGYVVSESVYFAPLYWLRTARNLFNDLKTSCEPSMFSLDKLLISIANDSRSSVEALNVVLPFLQELSTKEKEYRAKLRVFGKLGEDRITPETSTKKKRMQNVEVDFECEVCRMNLYVSMVVDTQDDLVYCLEHAYILVEKNPKLIEKLKLKYILDENELSLIPAKIATLIDAKLQKKAPSKFAGMPTLLK